MRGQPIMIRIRRDHKILGRRGRASKIATSQTHPAMRYKDPSRHRILSKKESLRNLINISETGSRTRDISAIGKATPEIQSFARRNDAERKVNYGCSWVYFEGLAHAQLYMAPNHTVITH
jgi:hypothetical protein